MVLYHSALCFWPTMQSLRDQVNDLLTEYSSYIHRYFQVLTSIAESANADDKEAEVLVRQICDTDRKLQAALTRSKRGKCTWGKCAGCWNYRPVEEHQARQKQILRVQDEIQKHQEALLRMVEQLNETREDLDQELAVASKELEKIKYAEQCKKKIIHYSKVFVFALTLWASQRRICGYLVVCIKVIQIHIGSTQLWLDEPRYEDWVWKTVSGWRKDEKRTAVLAVCRISTTKPRRTMWVFIYTYIFGFV